MRQEEWHYGAIVISYYYYYYYVAVAILSVCQYRHSTEMWRAAEEDNQELDACICIAVTVVL